MINYPSKQLGNYRPPVALPYLRAHFPLSEQINIHDVSGYYPSLLGSDPTYSGSRTALKAQSRGLCYFFDGVGGGTVVNATLVGDGTHLNYDATTSFSVAVWINCGAGFNGAGSGFPGLVTKLPGVVDASTTGWYFNLRTDAGNVGKPYLEIADGTHHALTPLSGVGNVAVDDNKWHLLVGTVDRVSQTISLYVDGNPVPATASTSTIGSLSNASALRLGNRPDNGGITANKYVGYMKDVMVWSGHALTPGEINQLYNWRPGKNIPNVRAFESLPTGPPFIDSNVVTAANSGATITLSNFTNDNANDIVLVIVGINNSAGTTRTVSSISATGLTFSQRAVYNGNYAGNSSFPIRTEVWWALATSRQVATTVTVTLSGTPANTSHALVVGVQGANTLSPFDVNTSLGTSGTANATNSTNAAVTFSTSGGSDLLLYADVAGDAFAGGGTFTTPTGWTAVQGPSGSAIVLYSKSVTAQQTGITVSSSPLSTGWQDSTVFVDALVSPSGSPGSITGIVPRIRPSEERQDYEEEARIWQARMRRVSSIVTPPGVTPLPWKPFPRPREEPQDEYTYTDWPTQVRLRNVPGSSYTPLPPAQARKPVRRPRESEPLDEQTNWYFRRARDFRLPIEPSSASQLVYKPRQRLPVQTEEYFDGLADFQNRWRRKGFYYFPPTGSELVAKLLGLAVTYIPPGIDVSKLLGLAVTHPPPGIDVAKLLGLAVTHPPAGADVAKLLGLVVVEPPINCALIIPVFPDLPVGFPVKWSPTFKTTIPMASSSGREVRFANQPYALHQFELLYEELRDQTQNDTPYGPFAGFVQYMTLCQFWLSMYGQFGLFYFNCPWDNSRALGVVGTGDGATTDFTIFRTYGGFAEPIGAINQMQQVYFNGVLQSPASYATVGNILVFNSAPPNGTAITANFTFYYLCRFLEDKQDFEEFMKNRWTVKSLKFRSTYWPLG